MRMGPQLASGTAGTGGPHYSSGGNKYRGQANANDFAPNVSFMQLRQRRFHLVVLRVDNHGGRRSWSAGHADRLRSPRFCTVARHEFLHGLGIVRGQPTYDRLVSGTTFVGANAKQANRGNSVPLRKVSGTSPTVFPH